MQSVIYVQHVLSGVYVHRIDMTYRYVGPTDQKLLLCKLTTRAGPHCSLHCGNIGLSSFTNIQQLPYPY